MANTIITLDQLEYILLELKDYIDNNAGTTIGWDYVLNKPVTFPPSSHTHDDRYYTETEVDTLLDGKSDTGHTHSQYLTEHATVDDALSDTSTNAVQNKVVNTALAGKANTSGTYSNLSVGYATSSGSASSATNANYLYLAYGNEINFKGGIQDAVWFNYRNENSGLTDTASNVNYVFGNYAAGTSGVTITAATFSGNLSGTANAAYYADYAEFFPRGEETEVGDIIALDEFAEIEQYIKATEKSICVIGVHSEDYGMIVGGENPENETASRENYLKYNISKYIPVSLAGRVPVKFKGISHKGVRVVPSEIPGVGRAFDATKDDRDSIIGYLVESDNGDNEEIRLLKMKIK